MPEEPGGMMTACADEAAYEVGLSGSFINKPPMLTRATREQIEGEIEDYYRDVALIAKKNAAKAHIYGDLKAQRLLGIQFSDSMVEAAALKYAQEYGKLLGDEGASIIHGEKVYWLRDEQQETRAKVAEILETGLKEGKPVSDIRGRPTDGTIAYDLKQYLKGEDSRLDMIARTEIARFESEGTKTRYADAGVTEIKWLAQGDACEICMGYKDHIFKLNEVPELPVHPRCKCAYAPVVTSIQMQITNSPPRSYPREHACRLNQPEDFQATSFRRIHREHNGKEYDVILGKLKGDKTMTEQAYRYSIELWSIDDAKKHCETHEHIAFNPATERK